MMLSFRSFAASAAWLGLMLNNAPSFGDEGMWLFNNPPLQHLKKQYGFEPTPAWLEHVQKSSVRFNSGGSGSFVSANGLVMTNHHVAADDLQKLSSPEKNYLIDGFHARKREDELKCKGLELNVLQSIRDVTADVTGAVKPGLSAADAFKARQAKIAEIEAGAADPARGIRADVVTLYQGGQYHLYTFKKYTDIRLVFAPEKQAAFFGGDPDNFEFPRYDLDVAFFRVYENNQPLQTEHYLKWSPNGSQDGELVFVSGHPGRTSRKNTMAELEYLRDTGFPYLLQRLNRLEVLLSAYADQSEDNRAKAQDDLFGIQNSRKARNGGLGGLLDPQLMARKADEEKRLKAFIAQSTDPEIQKAAQAFAIIAQAEEKREDLAEDLTLLEFGSGFNCTLFSIARTLARAAEELPKPSGERLSEFGDARLDSLKFQLFTDSPIYEDYEILKLADGLTFLATSFGGDDELVQKVLAGKSPRERAFELVSGTKLKDVAVRQKLFAGGKAALASAQDPMIALAQLVDPKAREVRKQYESEVEEPKRQAHAALAKARYAMDGASTYPDATFTLRLAFGTVKGYTVSGVKVPPFTQMGGMFTRAAEHKFIPPFDLPKRWLDRKDKLNLQTPFNFVCTADIIGGNSGSPVINKQGEVVGLIFDGNIQSLVLDFIYDQSIARAVSVDSRAITEALRSMYTADELLKELTGKP
ncbi:MAG: S46 family peptidase [Bacteroidales bacterium]|nr:S46 family peptidase [Bacteroidales bacterium]